MIRRLVNGMAQGASLVVTDRRWGATMSAAALGFGLFVGVAIGPGAAGTLATSPQQLIEIPSLAGNDDDDVGTGEASGSPTALAAPAPSPAPSEESSSLEAFPSVAPLAPETSEPSLTAKEPAPKPKPPAAEEPEEVETTELVGTVVHANPAAGSYALTIKGGELVPVHAAKLPRSGTKVSIEAHQLANGTFVEEGSRKRDGQATTASFRGAVTFVDADPLKPSYAVSGRGASLLVTIPPDPTGVVPLLPTVGSYVTADVAIEQDATLVQRKLEVEPGEPTTYLDLSGIYAGLNPETGQLLLSADDTRASGQDLLLTLPPEIDTSNLKPGASYMATATVEPDGTLKLAGIASDEHRKGADDKSSAQGDLKR